MKTLIRNVAIGACLLLAATTFAAATNPFFIPPVFPGSGASVTADFNGDGKPDLVFADGTVLIGNGDGTFTTGTKLSVSGLNTATLIATADFNGDGKPDLVVNSQTLNTFSVLLGNGDGTFQAAIVTSTSTPITSLAAADLNGDSKADILATTGSPAALTTFISQGNGHFAAGIVSGGISAGQLADFNGDGKLDLLPAQGTGVQLGQGNGTFGALQAFPAGALVGSVIGDFNGDGKLDVLATNGSPTSPQLQVLFGNGDGTFHAATAAAPPAGTLTNATFGPAVDLNSDSKSELLVSNGALVQVLSSNGDGTFTVGGLYNSTNQFSSASNFFFNVSIADFNKDGKLDVAAFNTMLLGNGDGTLKGSPTIANFGSGSLAADVNKDGHTDILSVTTDLTTNNADINVYLNDGHANFTLTHSYPVTTGVFTGFALGAIADLNGDGKVDIVGYTVASSSGGGGWTLVVLLGNGDGSFQSPVTYPGGPGATVPGFSLADLNTDGKPDVVLVANVLGGGVGVLNVMLNAGDGSFGAPSTYFASSPDGSPAVADFNGDGQPDVLVGTDTNGIAFLAGKADGTFQPATYITNTTCGTICGSFIEADVNGDGKPDAIEVLSGSFQVLLGNGDGTFSALAPSTALGSNVNGFQAADINSDGKLDLIGGSNGTSSSLLTFLLGNGDGTFGSSFTLQPSGIPVIADFNGDGTNDLGVQLSTGQFSQLVLLFNNSTPIAPGFTLTAGSGGTATVAAGTPASYTLSLSGTGGFTGNVALSCSGAPTGATCSVSPTTVMVDGTKVASATVTVTSTARSELLPIGFNNSPTGIQANPTIVISSLLAAILVILTILKLSRISRRRQFVFGALAATLSLLLVAAGCGGSSSSGGNTSGTPAGTYTIVVTGSAGSGPIGINETTNLTLIIQ